MNKFDNLFWVCGHIGFANDSFTVFMNLHSTTINYQIIRDRMRVSKSGMLLNWAWYYPRWQKEQRNDPNLYKQLDLDEGKRFAQAHFVMRETQLLEKFPGSKTITLLAENPASIDYYIAYAHFKLLDKQLYGSWYDVQKKNYPLNNIENQKFADQQFEMGMTPLQYRSIAFQDWQGKLVKNCKDPVAEWNEHNYHNAFMENKKTILIDHDNCRPGLNKDIIYIDRLVNPKTKSLNKKYYLEICNSYGLIPNLNMFEDFWNYWLNHQPDISTINPQLSWNISGRKIYSTC